MKLFKQLDEDFEHHSGSLSSDIGDYAEYEYARISYAFEVLYDHPIAFWRLGESTSSSPAEDETSNSYDAVYMGSPTMLVSTPKVDLDYAITLDGIDDYIFYQGPPAISLANQSFTIEFWAKRLTIDSAHTLISQGETTTNKGLNIGFTNSNEFRFSFYNNDLITTSIYTDNDWHHWVCTFDATTKKRVIYRDGQEVATDISTNNLEASGNFVIGKRWVGQYFHGSIDDVAIYKTALSSERVKTHYDAGIGLISEQPLNNSYNPQRHYDLRYWHNVDLTVPRTMIDMRFYPVTYYKGMTMLSLRNQRIVEGRTFRPQQVQEVDAIDGADLDNLTQDELEQKTLTLGNEEWPVDPDVEIKAFPEWRYANGMKVQLTTGETKTVTSNYLDDIVTDFNTYGYTYYIELVLRDFPSQDNIAHLDLDNSYIDFSSSYIYDDEVTDSIKFSDSLHPITSGGDTYWQINRNIFSKIDRSDLKKVRFRLKPNSPSSPTAPSASEDGAGNLDGTYTYAVTFVTEWGETLLSDWSNDVTVTNKKIDISSIQTGPTGTIARYLYRRGGNPIIGTMNYLNTLVQSNLNVRTQDQIERYYIEGAKRVGVINNNTDTTYQDNYILTGSEADPPARNSASDFIFKCQAMRLYENETFTFKQADVDTKRYQFARSIPRSGTPEHESDHPPIILRTTRPKNLVEWVRFFSGHHPTGSKDNKFSYIVRYNRNTGEHIRVEVSCSSTQTRIKIVEDGKPIVTVTGNALTEVTPYYLMVNVDENQIRASVYESNGLYTGEEVVSTGWNTITGVRRGYTGFSFNPYNYDFAFDYIRNARAEFANFESSTFRSITPVIGVTINPRTSQPIDMLDGAEFVGSSDDVDITYPETSGNPPPSMLVTRNDSLWYGGIKSKDRILLGDPTEVLITGDIYPVNHVRGRYRIVLIDKNGSIGFMEYLDNLLANRWNHFEIPAQCNITPAGFSLMIHQVGYYQDSFLIDNLKANHQTISWEASADGGISWQPFLHAMGKKYSAVGFVVKGVDLKVRASALSDSSWIHGYELIPRYGFPGHS